MIKQICTFLNCPFICHRTVSVSPDYDEGFLVLIALTKVGRSCCHECQTITCINIASTYTFHW